MYRYMTKRLPTMIAGLAAVGLLVTAAQAQETQQSQDTTMQQDTRATQQATSDSMSGDSAMQNPPGYRGMERPTIVYPPDSTAGDTSAGRFEESATGVYNNSTWQDTSAARQNPPGYRGMERPVGGDSLQPSDSSRIDSTTGTAGTDTTGIDTTGTDTTGTDTTGTDTTGATGQSADSAQ